jgi:hypothetical protein
VPLAGGVFVAAGTSVVPRDSCATAAPHFLGLVAARLAHVLGAIGTAGAGAAGCCGAGCCAGVGVEEVTGAAGGRGVAAGDGEGTAAGWEAG